MCFLRVRPQNLLNSSNVRVNLAFDWYHASMQSDDDFQSNELADRVEKLESELAYIQHDFEAQNETILLHTKEIKKLENSISKLLSKVEQLKDGAEERDPLDEKPPHY